MAVNAFHQIIQPQGSSMCGQAVVAMLCGKLLDDVSAIMGTGRNYPRDVRRGLQHFGFDFEKSRGTAIVHDTDMPQEPCAVFAVVPNGESSFWHWVVWNGFQFVDPRGDVFSRLPSDWKANYYRIVEREAATT